MPIKNIILCADDYGLNASVSQGIIALLDRKRLSAVSCLTTTPFWSEQAKWLKDYQSEIGVGLHFNLTEGRALSAAYRERYGERFPTLPRLIIGAFLGKWDVALLEKECQSQLDCFVAEQGCLPDFIDGHQHIHQLPQVREAVLRVYERSLREKKAFLRVVSNMVKSLDWKSQFKQSIIYLCGAASFRRLLEKQSIPHNIAFAGIYTFPEAEAYSRVLAHFLKKTPDNGLIMCHPGLSPEQNSADSIGSARFQEYCYLASDQFIADCQENGVRLSKGLGICN